MDRDTQSADDPRRSEGEGRGSQRQEETGTRRSGEYGLHPVEWMRRYAQEMDRMFENWGLGGMNRFRWPAMEMFDRANQLVVRVELPGLQRDEVRVRVAGNMLTIDGERRNEARDTREGMRRSEWTYGRFSREIVIPPDVDPNSLTAQMRDGVLEITMPYKPERQAREIPIQEGTSASSSPPPPDATRH